MAEFERQRVRPSSLTPVLIEKWSEPVLREGFVPFPKRMLRCLGSLFGHTPEIERLAVVMAVVDYRRPSPTRRRDRPARASSHSSQGFLSSCFSSGSTNSSTRGGSR